MIGADARLLAIPLPRFLIEDATRIDSTLNRYCAGHKKHFILLLDCAEGVHLLDREEELAADYPDFVTQISAGMCTTAEGFFD